MHGLSILLLQKSPRYKSLASSYQCLKQIRILIYGSRNCRVLVLSSLQAYSFKIEGVLYSVNYGRDTYLGTGRCSLSNHVQRPRVALYRLQISWNVAPTAIRGESVGKIQQRCDYNRSMLMPCVYSMEHDRGSAQMVNASSATPSRRNKNIYLRGAHLLRHHDVSDLVHILVLHCICRVCRFFVL